VFLASSILAGVSSRTVRIQRAVNGLAAGEGSSRISTANNAIELFYS
jgi:hypothetical protein